MYKKQEMTQEYFGSVLESAYHGVESWYIDYQYKLYMDDKEEFCMDLDSGAWGMIVESLRQEEVRIDRENRIMLLQEALDV